MVGDKDYPVICIVCISHVVELKRNSNLIWESQAGSGMSEPGVDGFLSKIAKGA